MTSGIAFLIALAFTGTVALCIALEVVPKFGKHGDDTAQRPKYFWLMFNIGTGLLLIVSYLALKWAYAEPEPVVEKYYLFPEKTWYFVNPIECKSVKASPTADYTPETFAAKNECKTEEVDGNPNLIKVDCTEMLNNIFFMIKSKTECEKLKAVMAKEAGTESIFGYEPPAE